MRGERVFSDNASMTREELELLAHVRVAAPCPMKWSEMQGNEKKRLCQQCNLHVYKVSELTSTEAVALFKKSSSERVCAQLFHRLDGTVMTKDCPSAWSVGLSEAILRVGKPVGIVSTMLVLSLAAAIAFVTLFGDHIRYLLGGSSGGVIAAEPTLVKTKQAPLKKTLDDFSKHNTY